MALSDIDDRKVFDQVNLFGPLIVARHIEDASLQFFMGNSDDPTSLIKGGSIKPAVYKLPECEGATDKYLGSVYTYPADGSYMTAEVCPGLILTIQSTLRNAGADDENSWTAFFVRNGMKIMLTLGCVGTGIY